MVNGITWEEETDARLKNAKEKQMIAEADYKRAEQEVKYWAEFADTLAKALELDRQHRGIKSNGQHLFDPESLRKKSVRESLFEIAAAHNGLLIATQAVGILVDAGVFGDREHARGTIYATISRNKRYFKRERPGVYRLVKIKDVPLTFSV